jgi:4-hydroxy-tetrahydrodipicolinate synthase
MAKPLQGVLAIVQTPFDEHDRIDSAGFRRLVDWSYSVGADGLGTGMVSEILRLTAEERRQLTEELVQATAGRGPVFAAVGAESDRQAVELARHAEQAGCDAVMAAPPLTTRLSVQAHIDYYRAIAEAIDVPVVVQDASSYVGAQIPLTVYVQLLEQYSNEKILFKPEAAPIGPNLSALRDATSGKAKIYEGSGGFLLIDSYRRGIAGTMPGLDLLDGIVAIWRALEQGDDAAAYRVYFPLCAIVTLQLQAGLDGFLAIEKYLLCKRGVLTSQRRRNPQGWSLDEETAREVDRLFELMQHALS